MSNVRIVALRRSHFTYKVNVVSPKVIEDNCVFFPYLHWVSDQEYTLKLNSVTYVSTFGVGSHMSNTHIFLISSPEYFVEIDE